MTIPVDGGLSAEQERVIFNVVLEVLQYVSPFVDNGDGFGASEPPAEYKRDGVLAYADGTNWNPGWGPGFYRYQAAEHEDEHWEAIDPRESYKSYTLKSRSGSSGTFYTAGYYMAPAADSNLTQASTTQAYGSANSASEAHAFIVFGAATGSGGSGSDRKIKLTVTGTRMEDDGTRTGSFTETITADAESLTLDDYLEGEKYSGVVTFTLSATGVDPYTSFSMDFNYGLAKYDDIGNHDFHINVLECTGRANANDAGFDIELMHHKATGWTYHASAFVAGAEVVAQLSTDRGPERALVAGEHFAYKRTNLHEHMDGTGSEGLVIRVTTTTNNSIEYMNCHVGYH